ncbi:MAG TPA: hypothetical protein PKH07_19550, partial [bacterium]|nr:hypothetical protein [bacterium]
GDALNGKIYELLANNVINNYGLQDRYVAFGSPNAIYSTTKMDWALFGRAATATLAPSTMALIGKIDWTSEIRRDLEEKYGKQLSQEYINRLATDFPFLAMNLFAGKTDIDGVNDFMSKFNSVTYEQHEIGLQMYDERLKWANLVATGKQMGLTDDECYAVLQMVRDSYSDQDRAKFDEWMSSGSFENDMKIAATLLDPLGGIAPLTRDPELQSSVMAGTMIAGALAGFAMGGPAGAVMGGLMGVFAGSEPFNLFNTNVFAQRELDKAKNFGIADPASDLKAFEDRSRDLQQLYKAHLERGDLDAAHKIALSGVELTNQIAEWALENKYALQQAGVLNMIRQDIANSHERWEASTIGDSLERDFVPRKLELPPEFTPGKDIMTLDG